MGRTRPVKEKQAERRARKEHGRGAEVAATLRKRGAMKWEKPKHPPGAIGVAVAQPVAPTIGRIVLVHRTTGTTVPAIVTHVHTHDVGDSTMPRVHLVVFDAMNREDALPSEALRWVEYGDAPGCWSWPPRAA